MEITSRIPHRGELFWLIVCAGNLAAITDHECQYMFNTNLRKTDSTNSYQLMSCLDLVQVEFIFERVTEHLEHLMNCVLLFHIYSHVLL